MAQETKPSWWPELDVSESRCRHFKHLYTGCGCIHEGFRSLTVHTKDCVHTKHCKLTEEEYQTLQRALPCNKSDNIHVSFTGPCELCKSGIPLFFIRRVNSAQRLGFKIQSVLKNDDRSPARLKQPTTAQKPAPRSDDEIERRVQTWRDAVVTYEKLLDRRVDNRRRQRKDAYNAFIARERKEETDSGVPEADCFKLFNFTGGEGGDLLQKADRGTNICAYCDKETRLLNPPPEKLPCGCHYHRDCAADLFCLQANGLSRQRARCPCGKPKSQLELRRLHLEFADDTYPSAT